MSKTNNAYLAKDSNGTVRLFAKKPTKAFYVNSEGEVMEDFTFSCVNGNLSKFNSKESCTYKPLSNCEHNKADTDFDLEPGEIVEVRLEPTKYGNNLDEEFIRFIVPRLKEFRKKVYHYPSYLDSFEQFEKILDEMIEGFEYYGKNLYKFGMDMSKFRRALKLFSKHMGSLWL